MNHHNESQSYWKYAKKIIVGTITALVLGFVLIPQFSSLRYKNKPAEENPDKASLPVKEPQHSAPVTTSNYSDPFTGMEFVLVKGGCYDMGDTFGDGDIDEKPVHNVCLDDFYIGKYEVTIAQWNAVMQNPSRYSNCGGNCPVEQITWDLAQAFINNLNEKTGKNYRLPTEAEWEYAARSGGKRQKWAGTSDRSLLGAYAWIAVDDYESSSSERIHPVGQKRPNGLGLYDMSGNAGEWVADWYDSNYYSSSPKNNPQGPMSGTRKRQPRVQRWGAWFYPASFARVTNRGDIRILWTGFRLAMTP